MDMVCEDSGLVYVSGNRGDATQKHLFCISIAHSLDDHDDGDGDGHRHHGDGAVVRPMVQQLSRESGWHSAAVSPVTWPAGSSQRIIVDVYR